MIKPEDFENDRVIWREETILSPHKIPEGYKKCAKCGGSGKVIKIYHDPGPNEYMQCFVCNGLGIVPCSSLSEKGSKQK